MFIPKKEGKHPCVIYCHGLFENHSSNLKLKEKLVKNGNAVYSFDFCGGCPHLQGKSDGDPLQMSVLTEKKDLECV